jgi:hypothetical protein
MIAVLIYPDRAVVLPVPDGLAAKYCTLASGYCSLPACCWMTGRAAPGHGAV